jgi:hypothetical protein
MIQPSTEPNNNIPRLKVSNSMHEKVGHRASDMLRPEKVGSVVSETLTQNLNAICTPLFTMF